MNKKLLLGLGASAIAVLPVLAVVSCSSETPKTNLNITIKPEATLKLVKEADKAYGAAKDDAEKIEALKPIFEGITVENFKNFDAATSPKEIKLTAKPGFTFAGQPTLVVAPKVELVSLNIKVKQTLDNIVVEAISGIEAANELPEGKDQALIEALAPVFEGVDETNIVNFVVSITEKTETTKSEIVLTANEGFGFGADFNDTLTSISLTKLVITAKMVRQDVITTATHVLAAANELPEGKEAALVDALSPLFDGISVDNINNVTITPSGEKDKEIITLTAMDGFVFENSTELVVKVTTLDVELIPATQDTLDKAIVDIKAAQALEGEAINPALVLALSPIFKNINESNIINITIITIEVTDKKPAAVKLMANAGYTFISGIEIVSQILLNITPKPYNGTTTPVAIDFFKNPDPTVQKNALGMLFDNVPTIIQGFTYEISADDTHVILTAKPGYSFAGGALTIMSAVA